MKVFSVVILSVLLLSISVRISFVYGWYAIDVESFIEQLCENNDSPQLECNGKCYLSKVSNHSSSQEEQTLPVLEWDQLVFCLTESSIENQSDISILKSKNFYYLIPSTEAYSHSIFHPPQI